MRVPLFGLALVAVGSSIVAPAAQEKPVDANSERITIQGCARGRSFIAVDPSSDRPVEVRVAPGRTFRLSGKKDVLKEMKGHEAHVVEVTGIIKKSDLSAPQGMPIGAGGRIRVGGPTTTNDPSRVDARRDVMTYVPVLDVESFRPLGDRCPAR